MGAGGMYPNQPYSDGNMGHNHPYYGQGGQPFPGHVSPYNNPQNFGMGYGRGYQRPYSPMHNYDQMMNNFPSSMFPNQMFGQGFFNLPRSSPTTRGGGLQSAPPSSGPDGNIHLNRPGEHRPHFDEQ